MNDAPVTDRQVRTTIESLLRDTPEAVGEPLSDVDRSLVEYGVSVSVVVLDLPSARSHAVRALELGATVDQLQEVAVLVSGLGVHTLMAASQDLVEVALSQGRALPDTDHDDDRVWQRYVGGSSYWQAFEARVPGFLRALRQLSPDAFETFFRIGALTFRAQHLSQRTIELVSIAVDVVPQHRFLPGLALHVDGAIRAGTNHQQIEEAVEIGFAAPPSPGVGAVTNRSS